MRIGPWGFSLEGVFNTLHPLQLLTIYLQPNINSNANISHPESGGIITRSEEAGLFGLLYILLYSFLLILLVSSGGEGNVCNLMVKYLSTE